MSTRAGWSGVTAEHFQHLILRLDGAPLDEFRGHLERFRTALAVLHAEVQRAAQAEKANLPVPPVTDVPTSLAKWRDWPTTTVDLILGAGWAHLPRSRSIAMNPDSVRELERGLVDAANDRIVAGAEPS